MYLTLTHCPNPDVIGGYWSEKPTCPKSQRVSVASIADASKALRAWVEEYDLGGGNMGRSCGDVSDGKKLIARISYNGRAWDLTGEEIAL